jgi:hypothetical protein
MLWWEGYMQAAEMRILVVIAILSLPEVVVVRLTERK